MTLEEQFNTAAADSKNLSSRPDNATLLKLYSLYKQATVGDNTEGTPANAFDFVARAKSDAWSELAGTSKESAMQQYVDLVAALKNR